ncbi:MAG: LutB/LldF family L-lactate oxidation iron-sulfur protein [Paludibacter sp.]|jgi:L-lactate dehydrogenase complex protein LldF|nr:LutB/LldF family L-lactate oxidation iron-sulfur protein [Paludibacter sp.]
MSDRQFQKDSASIAFDLRHRQTIDFNIGRYDVAVAKGMARYRNLEAAKRAAAAIKREVLTNWEHYLLEFEKQCQANGTEVLWATDSHEAGTYLRNIIRENKAKLIVKSKSMTTEEIELNKLAQEEGCESLETDLGEFIVQVAGEKPYHIVTPAMHKSKEDVAKLFHEKFGTPADENPVALTNYVRELLRKKYYTADIGITGANFLVAETGSVSVTENEGNAILSTAFPRIHVVIAGIEKLIPRLSQLGLLYQVLAAHGTGQQITAYNSLFTGPRQQGESGGPEKMYVILIDNGRTAVYADDESWEALACIRCGACLNACPVYKTIGGYTYNTTYSGPIGSVLTPFLKGFKDFSHLSFASSLCGKCVEVCPVKIPLTDILLTNRRKAVEQGLRPVTERIIMKSYRYMAEQPAGFSKLSGNIKNIVTLPFNYTGWGPQRSMPVFTKKSFSQQYTTKKTKTTN